MIARTPLALASMLLVTVSGSALAANCPAVLTDCPTVNASDGNFGGKLKGRSIVRLSAMDYGLHADAVINPTTGAFISGTSDDAALKAALDDCAARTATLVLPPKPILIDGTGNVTAMIQNCLIEGTSQRGGIYSEPKLGTLILLRSKTVPPFHIRSDWSLRGVAFYHPDQQGAGATFTGSVVGNVLTIPSAVTPQGGGGAGIWPGYLLVGVGVPLATTIVSQTAGPAGVSGTFTLSDGMPTRTNVALSVSKPVDHYPPVLSDDGVIGASDFVLDDVTFINPYDALVGTPPRPWGRFYMTNVRGWALHDMFAPGGIGDSFHVGNVQLSPGAWFSMTGSSTATKLAINYGSQQNTIYHVKGASQPWQLISIQTGAESWRWGFRVDNTNIGFQQSEIEISGDSMGTVLQVPEGSSFYGFATTFRGTVGCNVVDWVNGGLIGSTNCFELSSTSSLLLADFLGYAQGDAILTNGASIKINGGEFQAGGTLDGSDRAIVRMTANVGQIQVQNAFLFGVACSQDANQCQHVRGIDTGGFAVSNLMVQNNMLAYFENDIKLKPGGLTTITGNMSHHSDGLSVLFTAPGGSVAWGNNNFANPPVASVSACGGGATVSGGGPLSGTIVVGNPSPVTSCQLTVPFPPTGNVVSAWAQDGTALKVNPTSGTTVSISGVAGADISGKVLNFDWRGTK